MNRGMMMNKRGIAILMSALVVSTQLVPVYGKEETLPVSQMKVLTLKEATKKAQDHSSELRKNEREYDLNKEKTDFAFNSGVYELWAVNDSNLSYTQKQKSILEEQIALNVSQAFEKIQTIEKQIEMMDQQYALQEKQLQKIQIEFQNGRKSNVELQQAKIELAKTAQNSTNLKKDRTLEYSKLSAMLGMNCDGYTLEEINHEYIPFETKLTIDQFASSRANEHISVWRAAEQVKLAYLPIYTTDYMELITKQENRKQAEDQKDLTVKQLEEQIRKLYVDNEKLQADYQLLLNQIAIEEKQLEASKIYFNNGKLSALDYEKQLLNHEQSELKLEQMLNGQVYNVTLLKKPYLISSMGGL